MALLQSCLGMKETGKLLTRFFSYLQRYPGGNSEEKPIGFSQIVKDIVQKKKSTEGLQYTRREKSLIFC